MPRKDQKMLRLIIFLFLTQSIQCEEWIKWSSNRTSVPKNSVLVSNDIQGSYYVIRIENDGVISPGSFSPELQQVFVSDESKIDGHLKEFEVKIFSLEFKIKIYTF